MKLWRNIDYNGKFTPFSKLPQIITLYFPLVN